MRVSSDGSLSGSGTINADLVNTNGGIVGSGNSPGTMSVNGDNTQDETSFISFEIGGLEAETEYDVFDVSGDAFLAGQLDVVWYDGFEGGMGDTFDVFSAESCFGDFGSY